MKKKYEELYNEVKAFLKYIYQQLNELSPTNDGAISPRDIAEAEKDRKIGSSEYSQVAEALNNNINPKSVGKNSGDPDGRQ